MYINRSIEQPIINAINTFKVVLITGPRQVGKSTTLKHLFPKNEYRYVSLDDYNELEIAKNDSKLFFLNHPGKLIIDEIQYAPELFREIKLLVDQSDEYGQYILIGSQTFSLMQGVTESLAGRVGIIRMDGLSMREIIKDDFNKQLIPNDEYFDAERKSVNGVDLWSKIFRGSLPELTKNPQIDKEQYYASYVTTYLERDVRSITNVRDLGTFAKFIRVLAARVAQVVNYSEVAKEVGVDSNTIKSWISVLESSGLIFLVQPFSNNRLSRVIKSPVLYFADSGLVSYLLRWTSVETLMRGAMSGHILENYVVVEIIKSFQNHGIIDPPIYFYRDKDQKEIDLIIESSGILYPVEIKQSASPDKSMAKHFDLLKKVEGYKIGNQLILCQIDRKMYLAENLITYPLGQI
ncbi:MAG: ATP-binding protein [Saccharofermentanales bacterium]|jgi:predicted AAA+ superfamily ATPase